ncbi:PTS sugar transporter subunit IIA [Agromyces intestinalis]|uniref:Ascorbate-specific PTS system EIIA component n=1 Tax=Agromyces intestinalis TaxID=2592652 RepID=A0A5C1YEY5_9MICO|nr:PTS sugar transporter subunit IIA [Agromyces intestinalis]QEO13589.1 PTS sugar transporter subunit IIA [Agromyces intestinalis]
MPLPPLPDEAVVVRADAADWRAAVRAAGRGLVRSGAARADYTDRMIAVIEEFGAYVVIAPGLALAHARPGPDVRHAGLSVATLATPVAFGHPHNDPVRVVIGLAVASVDEHVAGVASLANVFNDPAAVGRLAAATTPDEVRAALGAVATGAGTDASEAVS